MGLQWLKEEIIPYGVNPDHGYLEWRDNPGGGGVDIQEINVDAATAPGTDPVVATAAGVITVTGNQVASGTTANVVRTHSTAANSLTVEVQRSTSAAVSTVASNGVSHFDSSSFAVDANGFVTLLGGTQAIDSIGVDASTLPGTDPVLPDAAGLVTVTGAQVASGTVGANVIRTNSTAANAYTIEIQRSTTAAATDSSINGVSHFNSADFTVDANGFVSLAPAGPGETITGDTGGALSPTANNWNIVGGTNCSTSGSVSTLTINMAWDWTEVTAASVNAAVQNGYILNNAGLLTVNLPGTCAVGDEIRLAGKGAGLYVVDAPAGDTIHYGNQDTSSGGTLTATNRYDSIHLLCTAANSEWTVLNSVGNFTVA
jgi:hypothetical protein